MYYPHKKHFVRKDFFANFENNFSKQWDVKCKWNFKNKYKMYGSVQFDSLLMAGNDREVRTGYLRDVIKTLKDD